MHGVLQLPHVARPVVLAQAVQGAPGEALAGLLGRVELVQETLCQQVDIGGPFAQRRNPQREHRQAVQQVFPEPSLLDRHLGVAVGRGDDPDVGGELFGSSDPVEGGGLEHAQQLDLHLRDHFRDLVQEDGAAGGAFEIPRVLLDGAGEAAFLVAEQFPLDQRRGDGTAVDRDEGTGVARALLVQGTRDQLLAGAAFAHDQHRQRGGGHLLDLLVQLPHGYGAAVQQPVMLGWGSRANGFVRVRGRGTAGRVGGIAFQYRCQGFVRAHCLFLPHESPGWAEGGSTQGRAVPHSKQGAPRAGSRWRGGW